MPRPALAFASSTPLTDAELRTGRFPRPSRLAEPLAAGTAAAAKGAERLGLHTVGDLLEHLPRDRSEARTIAELATDEVATVVVEVRSITLAPGPPARDEAARGGDRRRRDGDHEGDVLQPAVARAQVPARDAADAPGQVPGPQRASGCSSTRRRASRRARAATSRPTRRPRGSRRRRSPRWCASTATRCATSSSRCPPGCARPGGWPDRPARARPPRTSATSEAGPRPARLRGAAAAPARAAAPPRAAPRGRAGRGRSTRRGRSRRAGWRSRCPFTPTDDQARGDGGDRRGPRARGGRCSGC